MATSVTSTSAATLAAPPRSYAGPMVLAGLLALAAIGPVRAQTKAFINRETKSFSLVGDIRKDHQIFGYTAPDIRAKKLILFSVFTSDVKGNPYHCPLGAYYQTSGLPKGDDIRFVSTGSGFVKLTYLSATKQATPFYIRREFIEFD